MKFLEVKFRENLKKTNRQREQAPHHPFNFEKPKIKHSIFSSRNGRSFESNFFEKIRKKQATSVSTESLVAPAAPFFDSQRMLRFTPNSLPYFSNFPVILLRENFKTPQFRPGPFMKKKDGNQVDIRTGKHWDTLKKSFRRETTTTTTECCVRPYVLPFVVTVSLPSTYRSSDYLFLFSFFPFHFGVL